MTLVAINELTWPSKDPEEKITAMFDFRKQLRPGEELVDVTLTVTVASGEDATPAAIKNGTHAIVGGRVYQRLHAGIDEVSYLVVCRAPTSDGNLYVQRRVLPVREGV